ncbi:hypothetical protein D9M68_549440 [compost metagenome]
MVLLPTPPLPEATATMLRTLGISCTPRCTAWLMTLVTMWTDTFSTPGTVLAAATSDLRMAACWLLAG